MAGKTRIIRRGRGHSYELNGQKVPGVTTLIGDGFPKPWLAGWTAKEISNYVVNRLEEGDDGHILADRLVADLRARDEESDRPQKWSDSGLDRMSLQQVLKGVQFGERDRAANRGTEIHGFAEKLARGEEVSPPEEIRLHVQSYLDFLNGWKPRRAMVERVVVSTRYRYMGKTDLLTEFEDERLGRALLDVKTGKAVYDDTALQLAGYGFAEHLLGDDGQLEPMPDIDWYGVVHVRADGFAVYPFDVTEHEFRCFLYAQQLARWTSDDGRGSTVRGDAMKDPKEMIR